LSENSCEDMDVTVLYCTTVAPFAGETLRVISQSNKIVVVEPYYEGVLVPDICAATKQTQVRVETIGVPHKVLTHYGKPEQHDEALGLTPAGIRLRTLIWCHNCIKALPPVQELCM
jgi:transketolase